MTTTNTAKVCQTRSADW